MPNRIKRYFILLTAVITGLIANVSCIYEDGKDYVDFDPALKEGKVKLLFQISPAETATAAGSVTERIKSLRIILVNSQGIECNRYVSFNSTAAQFNYDFNWYTDPGVKQLYLIANEEYVSDIEFQQDEGITLPKNLPTNLTDLLELYQPADPDSDDESVRGAEEFINVMNSIYFEPEFTEEGSNIYLPYSVCYPDIQALQAGTAVSMEAYLVPVATKFYFYFTNKRPAPVQVEGISLKYVNKNNFLYARVSGDDYEKAFGSGATPEYWVNWLAKVAKASWEGDNWQYGPNMDFNLLYGWISNYALPAVETSAEEPSDPLTHIFIPVGTPFTVDALEIPETEEEDPVPGTHLEGPFYLPECKNFLNAASSDAEIKDQEGNLRQGYYLTMKFTDLATHGKPAPTFEDMGIDNLKSLFRNTLVIIHIVMGEGGVDVYAEIAPWTMKSANGWVNEGKKPSSFN